MMILGIKNMEDVGILAPNTYEEELGLPQQPKNQLMKPRMMTQ